MGKIVVDGKVGKAAEGENKVTLTEVWRLLQLSEYRRKLMACGVTWFLFDVVAYGAALLVCRVPEQWKIHYLIFVCTVRLHRVAT